MIQGTNASSTLKPWRLLDTGVLRAAENFAINRAIMESYSQGDSPNTLRFLSFGPAALIGFHQDVDQELNREYIQAQGIDLQRRLTGGGAIYMDPRQIGWELYLNKGVFGTADMGHIARRICETMAKALQELGVDAHFRPRNDIEVAGRKISGTGGYFDGDSVLYQGTILVDFDVVEMLRVLRIPAAKLTDKAIADASQRIVTMRELLGAATPTLAEVKRKVVATIAREFAIEWREESGLSAGEAVLYQTALSEIDSPEWVYQHNRPRSDAPMVEALYRAPGGLFRVAAILDPDKDRLKQVWITGDFFVKPRRLVADLEAALRDSRLSEVEHNVHQFFARYEAELLMLTADDFVRAIQAAVTAA